MQIQKLTGYPSVDKPWLKYYNNKFENPSYIPYAYKIKKSFLTSPISGKRDYTALKTEKYWYLKIVNNTAQRVSFNK